MLQLPQIILIAGEQPNVGQNDLACNIISRFYRENDIYGLKAIIDSENNNNANLSPRSGQDFEIFEEKSMEGKSDTARMLQAGAEKAFKLITTTPEIEPAIEAFLKTTPKNAMIVCQSNSLHNHIKPGIFLAIRQLYCKICAIDQDDIFSKADRIITYTVNSFDISMDEFSIENGVWKLKKH